MAPAFPALRQLAASGPGAQHQSQPPALILVDMAPAFLVLPKPRPALSLPTATATEIYPGARVPPR